MTNKIKHIEVTFPVLVEVTPKDVARIYSSFSFVEPKGVSFTCEYHGKPENSDDEEPTIPISSFETMFVSWITVTYDKEIMVTRQANRKLHDAISKICERYGKNHPGRIMWLFGYGQKILSNTYTIGDNKPIRYDPSTLSIECSECEGYEAICKNCGKKWREHNDRYGLNPKCPTSNKNRFEPRENIH